MEPSPSQSPPQKHASMVPFFGGATGPGAAQFIAARSYPSAPRGQGGGTEESKGAAGMTIMVATHSAKGMSEMFFIFYLNIA